MYDFFLIKPMDIYKKTQNPIAEILSFNFN